MQQSGQVTFRAIGAACIRRSRYFFGSLFIHRGIINEGQKKISAFETHGSYNTKKFHDQSYKFYSSFLQPAAAQFVIDAADAETMLVISRDVIVYPNFVTEEEEKSLVEEVEPYLKRLKYESDHWDDAIHGYRETERKTWSQRNKGILERVKKVAFPADASPLAHVHVLDLMASGVIKPHIDSVRFCGNIVAGLSLLSQSVMRFVLKDEASNYADVLLSRRSLYIMRNIARYEYTHEVLGGEKSTFKGSLVPKERRIAIICRNEASDNDSVSTEH